MSRPKAVRIRFGCSVIHAHSVDQVVDIVGKLNHAAPSGGTSLFERLGPAANQALNLLNGNFALHGKAAKSLGTALRVRQVRESLDGVLVRDIGHLSAGADAVRHLTVESIEATLQKLEQEVKSRSQSEAASGECVVKQMHNVSVSSGVDE